MTKEFIQKVQGGLIVSCQALAAEPLYSSFIMSRMALAAQVSGAVGIRANTVVDIQAIKDQVDLPLIGIIKQDYEGYSVFITPTLKEVRAVCAAGAEVVAMDGTQRSRPNDETLEEIITTIKKEYPEILLMADCSNLEDASLAESLGFDFVGTTLYGYTEGTQGCDIADNDFQFLKEVLAITSLPVIAEGKVDTPEKAKRVIELGCLCVVSGGAITRPQEITKRFADAVKSAEKTEECEF
ncbi:N-acetylmannosamine-6-phosphate 2-epimerase [Vagococcus salmoninarum]|uniref:N-acetylmannosamine-6-phosphate 2-epimerase n=2 Tax=Vagococcus salmoninarum TaxID=2739 RepID=UPI0018823745|nr:N-acetylmannosamine-6-phosphate 2-epimerase [Vagococcus salmoninarum]MBE9388716.1 N-acetylmannosamine-6-phosphate 2-epimerase [Vagococcus salmoninarum]